MPLCIVARCYIVIDVEVVFVDALAIVECAVLVSASMVLVKFEVSAESVACLMVEDKCESCVPSSDRSARLR